VSPPRSLHIVMAASEAIPYAKTGGLADVTGALPQELAKLGHDVILMLPRYRCLDESGRQFRVIARLPVNTPAGAHEAVIEEDVLAVTGAEKSVRVWALRQDRFFDRAGIYQEQGKDYTDNLERFAWFSRAAIETIVYLRQALNWNTDLLHLHDWQTSLCAVYLKTADHARPELQRIKTVLTLHNVGYQGVFPSNQLEKIGLPPALFTPAGLEFYGSTNLLKGGMVFADQLTTVSPTYAKEILTPKFGFGLEGVLKNRERDLIGIVNGIDVERWNPETDPLLPANYSATNRAGKRVCKRSLQREFSLPERDVPLLSVIARLTHQKGLDLVEAVIPRLLAQDLQFVLLGTGEPAMERAFVTLHRQYRGRMGVRIGFDEALAHRIEAGADMLLMPSRYEPCGLSQLYSLRYGTVPIVTKTGGLADTVIPVTGQTIENGTATGFHIDTSASDTLFDMIVKAVRMYETKKEWERLIDAGMKTDVSWAHSARSYAALFKNVVGE